MNFDQTEDGRKIIFSPKTLSKEAILKLPFLKSILIRGAFGYVIGNTTGHGFESP